MLGGAKWTDEAELRCPLFYVYASSVRIIPTLPHFVVPSTTPEHRVPAATPTYEQNSAKQLHGTQDKLGSGPALFSSGPRPLDGVYGKTAIWHQPKRPALFALRSLYAGARRHVWSLLGLQPVSALPGDAERTGTGEAVRRAWSHRPQSPLRPHQFIPGGRSRSYTWPSP